MMPMVLMLDGEIFLFTHAAGLALRGISDKHNFDLQLCRFALREVIS
jgi:hypothetical protein